MLMHLLSQMRLQPDSPLMLRSTRRHCADMPLSILGGFTLGFFAAAAATVDTPLPPLLPHLEPVVEAHSECLNASQAEALTNAFRSKLSAIRGPPGTGKTRTVAATAEALRESGLRTLIVTPADAAAQRVLECIVEANPSASVALVVADEYWPWHSESYGYRLLPHVVAKEALAFPGAAAGAEEGDGWTGSHWAEFLDAELRWGAEGHGIPGPDIVILTHGAVMTSLRRRRYRTDFDSSSGSGTAGLSGAPKDRSDEAAAAAARDAHWHRVVDLLLDPPQVGAVIVDEAAQLWDGHFLGLAQEFGAVHQFVVVGDENQLPPFGTELYRDVGAAQQKARSLFNSLLDHPLSFEVRSDASNHRSGVPISMLAVSYRLPRSISAVISKGMYSGRLQVHRDADRDATVRACFRRAAALLPLDEESIRFCNIAEKNDAKLRPDDYMVETWISREVLTRAACKTEADLTAKPTDDGCLFWVHTQGDMAVHASGSSFNELEARAVGTVAAELEHAFRRLRELGVTPKHEPPLRVVVITPYEAQRVRLEEHCADRLLRLGRFEHRADAVRYVRDGRLCCTVDAFQGQEADTVLVSLVRREGIGFMADQRRSNVMLSRAKHALYVFGDIVHWTNVAMNRSLLVKEMALECDEKKRVINLHSPKTSYSAGYDSYAPQPVPKFTMAVAVKQPPKPALAYIAGATEDDAPIEAVAEAELPSPCMAPALRPAATEDEATLPLDLAALPRSLRNILLGDEAD